MPSEVTVTTGFGEYVFKECQVSKEGDSLLIKRNGVPLLWTSWPWQVVFK